jgi:hypothetical protein
MGDAQITEQALLHHMLALRELPSDVIIPPRLELSQPSFDEAAQLVAKPHKPNRALRALMAGRPAIDHDRS